MKTKNRKGSTLVLVIIVMAVLSILTLALLMVSMSEVKLAYRQERKNQAHYLGQSGVYAGLKMMEDKIDNGHYTSLGALCTDLNSAVSNGSQISVTGGGSFNLVFSNPGSDIKIKSVGTCQGNPGASDTVTLSVKVSLPNSNRINTNPEEWFAGKTENILRQNELLHKMTPSVKNFPGFLISLNSQNKTIRYNQGGSEDAPSVFQASIIAFTTTEKDIPCFSQDSNVLDVTFDAEIIYFGNSIQCTKNKDIILAMSDSLLDRPDDGIIQPAAPKNVGMETFDRYKAFVNGYYVPDISDDVLHSYWDTYNFNNKKTDPTHPTSYKYGIVCFVKNVGDIGSDYYFFPGNNTNGMSIMNKNDNGSVLGYNNKLIPIASNDPIRDVLNAIFSASGSYRPYYWDNK